MLLNVADPVLMYVVVDDIGHSVNKEVIAMMV